MLGNGDGTFGVKSDYEVASGPFCIAVGDLNGDGGPDLATAGYYCDTVSVLLHTRPPTTNVGPGRPDPSTILRLLAPRPNPSRGASEIRFALPAACAVDVALYDLAGRRIRSLVACESLGPGEHVIHWDGRDRAGVPARDGVYLVRARAGLEAAVRKLVVLR